MAASKCTLSPVACQYAETLAHPDSGPLMGIPNGDTIYSKKLRVWCRGTEVTGAAPNTNVTLLCQPFAALANNINAVVATSGGTAFPGNLSSGKATNSPYTAADFDSTKVQGRLVSAVLRARFVGTQLNAGGVHYGMQEPTHGGIQNKDDTFILSSTCGEQRAITAGEPWFEVTYRPVDHHDTSWIDTITRTDASTFDCKSDGATVAYGAYPFMGIFTKAAAAAQTIQWEFWAVVEYAGPNVVGKTLTPPDLQGWASVIAAHSQFDEMHANINSRRDSAQSSYVSNTIKSYADYLLNAAAPYAKTFAVNAGTALLQNYLPRPRALPPARHRALLQ